MSRHGLSLPQCIQERASKYVCMYVDIVPTYMLLLLSVADRLD